MAASKSIVLTLSDEQISFVDNAAAAACARSRADFARGAILAASSAALEGAPAPASNPRAGRQSPLSAAAAAAGLSVKDFVRLAAYEKAGVPVPKAAE